METLILMGGAYVISFGYIYNSKKLEYKVTSITSKESFDLAKVTSLASLVPSSIIAISFTSIRSLCDFFVKLVIKLF